MAADARRGDGATAPAAIGSIALVAITDLTLLDGDALAARVAQLAEAVPPGALAIQVRARQLGGRDLYALATRLIAIARPRGATVWVNDRLDVALAAGVDGVHLPEVGLPVATVRALAPGLAIGVSRHRPDGSGLDGADRVHLGPIWATPSKAGLGEPLGPAALTAARPQLASALVAVGGIDGPARAHAAAAAGADAVAVIRALWCADDPTAVARALVDAVIAGRKSARPAIG